MDLYSAIVPAYKRMLHAQLQLIGRAKVFVSERSISEGDFFDQKITASMRPLSFQYKSVLSHSLRALQSLETGLFIPDPSEELCHFATLETAFREGLSHIESISPDLVNSRATTEVVFRDGGDERYFCGESFLLTFSQPNFYFHVITAYNILRMSGMEIGKSDFHGR